MVSSFTQFLVEEERVVYFTYGRMNPPTIGHGKLLDTLSTVAGKNPYKIFLSKSQDTDRNPLTYSDKIKHIRKMFPKHARAVIVDQDISTVFDAMVSLHYQGFRKVVMVVGSDRVAEFQILLNKYNGKEARHGIYNFATIKVVSAGERDPDSENVDGASASKQRSFAESNDFISFSQGTPSTISTRDAHKLFNDVRRGMGLEEENTFKNHIQLPIVDNIREQYVQGQLYALGDHVVVKQTEECGSVAILGANYIIIEMADGRRLRKWLDDVEIVESVSGVQPDYTIAESTGIVDNITPNQSIINRALMIRSRRLKGNV